MIYSVLLFLLVALFSYLLGSFPTSIVASRLIKGIDIREYGSGNAGGTNAIRLLGWKIGICVILIDIIKGIIATYYIARIGTDVGFLPEEAINIWAGLWAIIGHIWTVFANFKGGKGAAVAGGMLIVLYPVAFSICFAWFLLIAFITRYVSIASISSAILLPIILWIMRSKYMMDVSLILFYFAVFIALLIIFTHRSNIIRLIQGKENRFGSNKTNI